MVTDVLKNHPKISALLRQRFIVWIFDILPELGITDYHLAFQTIKLIDCYLANGQFPISNNEYLLLGATCLWMQSKMIEVDPLELKFVVKELCKCEYTELQFLKMETQIVQSLMYKLEHVTCIDQLALLQKQVSFYV